MNTQSVIASHSCFCPFFTSHPYILSTKCFNLLVIIIASEQKYFANILIGYRDDW